MKLKVKGLQHAYQAQLCLHFELLDLSVPMLTSMYDTRSRNSRS